ncbi:hypothetical protein Dvina_33395 [Dactylosporangium vinaceum]|uniref:TetR family transcriptional regulator n=1 Tax=Dactylosporangium vinaceum TaxID=53362 RepID=A0ABV5M9X3_9ACTN|nr:hypothetical protein [Dactylosporangium vinaceum]UAB93168.1 hypothetical protein Dvina_33395 [Dactylosporangium vinaceum]
MTDTAGAAGAQVLAYVDTNLALVAEGEHAVARALAAIAPGRQLDDGSRAMHEQLSRPLIDALRARHRPDPATTAELINAIVYSASSLIEAGGDTARIRARGRAARAVPARRALTDPRRGDPGQRSRRMCSTARPKYGCATGRVRRSASA